MTKTTAEMIAVMQAYERGERIEVVYHGSNEWMDVYKPEWCWLTRDYRIAPPKPVPHQIDWSHLRDDIVAIATNMDGLSYGYEELPVIEDFFWSSKRGGIPLMAVKSFKPGNMPWQESLVIRP